MYKIKVAGVSLGMTIDSARVAAVSFMHATASQIHTAQPSVNPITGKAVSSSFFITQGHLTLSVSVTADPKMGGKPVVDNIIYEVPWTRQNIEALESAALEKYSTPTFNNSGSIRWCEAINPVIPVCTQSKAMIFVENNQILGNDLTVSQRLNKWRVEQDATKPHF